MDKAGRVVIPKAIRKELQLEPGASLELVKEGERLSLRPVREAVRLIKKDGFWVIPAAGDSSEPFDAMALIDQMRLERELSFMGNEE